MEVIINESINIVNAFFAKSTLKTPTISIYQNDFGNWFVCDDLEIATLTVIRHMLKNNYTTVGQIHLIQQGSYFILTIKRA